MKPIFALLMAVLLAASSSRAAAQDVLSGPMEEGAADLPGDLGMADDVPAEELGAPIETIEPVPMEETIEGSQFGAYYNDPMHLAACPSLFESSGTWLRRGFWYAEGDYMLINRTWDRKGLLFAFEGATGVAPGTTLGGVPGFGPVLTLNQLVIEGSKPGADGMARVTLGRFLFRDGKNRDHNVQVTYFGGGNWKSNSAIQGVTDQGIVVNQFIDRVNPSFDGAESISFDYETGLDSIESNYLVKARMGRDQMVLHPDGNWVRSAATSQTYSFLAGIRYVNLTDLLNIDAVHSPDDEASEGGNYFVDCDNNLFGGQFGASVSHETARWSVGINTKAGSYWNRMHLNSEFLAGPELVPSRGSVDTSEDAISFVGEAEILFKWHLRPNMSIRAGCELLYVNKLALAPHQVNFVPGGYPPIADDDDVVCMGTAIGLEVYR